MENEEKNQTEQSDKSRSVWRELDVYKRQVTDRAARSS